MWEAIAGASDGYFLEKLDERVTAQHAKQKARNEKHPDFQVQTSEQIKEFLQSTVGISGRGLCVFIASTITPKREKFEHHWCTTGGGVIPRGYFNLYMTCDRFAHISLNLHFSSNGDRCVASDRASKKQRSIINVSQETFQVNFIPPSIMAFDEPCYRRDRVIGASGPSGFDLVVTDRFYTSVALAMQLLTMKFYSIGTIMMNGRGLCEAILPPKKNSKSVSNKRSKMIEQDTYQVVKFLHVPVMEDVR
ncbi:hypothetical protein PHMEG_00020151 [Phytophthora megakarya]|uniref:PiggyBac transposable element-derived protein domain-containing protein n=1 Tax=Phytophthora megakarya TaxID=4795 RepID=A0A225VQR5_9STRA|nr:hypothetical protein PHMEG_00020151 [Phytophthora megakarya]